MNQINIKLNPIKIKVTITLMYVKHLNSPKSTVIKFVSD